MAPLNEKLTRSCILVVGMHRSGTSTIAGSLGRAGISLGGNLLAPGEDNPNGYFEHADAVNIDDALLDALDMRWDDIRSMPSSWTQSAAAKVAREALKSLINLEFQGKSVFAVKDPRMCRLLPVWIDALGALSIEAKVLLVARDPMEVSASISRRNGWTEAVSSTLWLDYMLEAEQFSRRLSRAVITYDAFLAAPNDVLSEALDRVGLSTAAKMVCAADLSNFVSKDQRHHLGGMRANSDIGHLAQEVYLAFERGRIDAVLSTTEFDALRAKVRKVMAPSEAIVEGLSKMSLAFRREVEALSVQLAERQSQLNAQIEWSQAAINDRENLYASLSESQSQLTAQKKWSEDAVAERETLQAELARVRSSLLAQQEWSKQAVLERESLQAELADVRSLLTAQQTWAVEAVSQREALQSELAHAASQISAQQAWTEQAIAQRTELQAELADLASKLRAQIEWSEAAVLKQEQLYDEIHEVSQALGESSHQVTLLQTQINRQEATWLGRLNRWNLKRKAAAKDLDKETT